MSIATKGLMGIFSLRIINNAFSWRADGLICKIHLFSFFDNAVIRHYIHFLQLIGTILFNFLKLVICQEGIYLMVKLIYVYYNNSYIIICVSNFQLIIFHFLYSKTVYNQFFFFVACISYSWQPAPHPYKHGTSTPITNKECNEHCTCRQSKSHNTGGYR